MAFTATRPGAKMDQRVQLHAPERSLSFREEEQKQDQEEKGIAKVRRGEFGNSGTSTTFDEGEDDDSVCKMREDLQEHLNYCGCNHAVSLLSRDKREKRGSLSEKELLKSIIRVEEASTKNHRRPSILEAQAREERNIQNQRNRAGPSSSSANSKQFNSSCCFSDSQTATATTSSTRRRSLSRPETAQQLELLCLYAYSGDLACEGTAGPLDPGTTIGGGDDTLVNNHGPITPPRRTISRRGVERSYAACGIRSPRPSLGVRQNERQQRIMSPFSSLFRKFHNEREISELTIEILDDVSSFDDDDDDDDNDDNNGDIFEPLEF